MKDERNMMTLYELCKLFSIQPINDWWYLNMRTKAGYILIDAPYLETNKKSILGEKQT